MNMMTELAGVARGAPLVATMRLAGEAVDNPRRIEVRNPFTGSLVGSVPKATVEDVGWPLDLNKPKDRESVDKAISFHDL